MQRPRLILLAPLAMVLGAGWYLTAPLEPSPWAVAGAFLGLSALAIAIVVWPTPKLSPIMAAVRAATAFLAMLGAASAVGVGAASLKASQRPQTALQRPVDGAQVQGFILSRDRSGGRLRLIIAVTGFAAEGLSGPAPRRVRISMGEAQARFWTPGRPVSCRANLSPAAPPLAPGAYDFQRRAYFDGLDAVGFSVGACRPAPHLQRGGWRMRAQLWLAAVRADMAAAIVAEAPSQGGALAAAMIVGDRSYMTEEATQILQDAGLAHIISVSGLHMAVVGGFVFFLLKRGLALWPWFALRVPAAKAAAVGALAAIGVYFALSGASVPAQRAAIMAAVAFGAVLLDRPAISMRGLGLAAFLIVLLSPQAVVEPGFQMSFAATLALVAAYEALAHPDGPKGSPGPLIGGLQAAGRAMTSAVATSAVAGAATEIFAIQHFQRLTLYGLPVNLATAPVIAFVVAPGAVAAGLAAPWGAAGPPLRLTAAALDLVLALAQGFATRPEAVQGIAPFAPLAFGCAVAALLWLCLWRGMVRIGAAPLATMALAAQGLAGQPVAIVDAQASHGYVRTASGGTLALFPERQRRFERERLLALLGAWPRDPRQGASAPACGEPVCIVTLPQGVRAGVILAEAGFNEPCPDAQIMLSPLSTPDAWRSRCAGRIVVDKAGGGGVVRSGLAGLNHTQPVDRSARPWSGKQASGITANQ
jgi:competence protein ComEC